MNILNLTDGTSNLFIKISENKIFSIGKIYYLIYYK